MSGHSHGGVHCDGNHGFNELEKVSLTPLFIMIIMTLLILGSIRNC